LSLSEKAHEDGTQMTRPDQRHGMTASPQIRSRPSRIPKIWGLSEQNSYTAFTRPFFFPTQYKRRKSGLAAQD